MKKIQLNKKQKLVALIGGSIGLMIVLHIFVFTPRIRRISELQEEYDQVSSEYVQVQERQKPEDVLEEFLESTEYYAQRIDERLEDLMLYDPPRLEDEEEPPVSVGFETTLHPEHPIEDIYSVLVEKYFNIREVAASEEMQVNVLANWGLEEEIADFDPNAVPDLMNSLQSEHEVIERPGVSEDVREESRRRALRLRRELGFNMSLLRELDDELELIQRLLYAHFLEEHRPDAIPMSDMIKFMDAEIPEEDDGGKLVGIQGLMEYTRHVLALAEDSGVDIFESISFEDIEFDREAVEEPEEEVMPDRPGVDPAMKKKMFGPDAMDPAAEPEADPDEPVEEEPMWNVAQYLQVSFDIEFFAGNREGMEFLTRLTNGPGFFHVETLNIATGDEDEMRFRAGISNYTWINMEDGMISERGF